MKPRGIFITFEGMDSSGWFSKQLHEEGKITRESAERFGWFGLEKMRSELAARARENAG